MQVLIALVLAFTAIAAVPQNQQRIIGGSGTTISNYPEVVALLHSWGTTGHRHACGGIILNNRSILTAARCVYQTSPQEWRTRAGSTNAHSGGVTYLTSFIIQHHFYNIYNRDYDISIMRVSSNINFGTTIQQASIAGPNYVLPDNQAVWVVGWGYTNAQGSPSEQLRHVQIWTVNQNLCSARYTELGNIITSNMLCASWLDVDNYGKCYGDFGGPLYHNRVVVGVSSWSQGCAQARYPGVYTRVSNFIPFIQSNA
uniref:Trypsin-like proteinase n=1 Tax=Chilo suppressalis TaxID=168631 RepID=I3UIJ3_CHISP|nr:trypsin-like proteinase [Chilo suppressalis]